MIQWIFDKLLSYRNKKQQEVIKLRWQKMQLEKQLNELKKN